MAKVRPHPKKKNKPKPRILTPEQLERRRRWTRRLIHAFGLVVVVGGFSIGYRALADHVRDRYTQVDRPPALVLVNRPIWMNDRLAGEVARRLSQVVPGTSSTLDHEILVEVHDLLSRDAWIERVNGVRRVELGGRDTILIDCTYRTPLAIARWDDGRDTIYQLVDARGVLLPIRYEPPEVQAITDGEDRSTNLRIITGLTREPPRAPGARWDSPNLAAGLEVAALLQDEPAARDVVLIDVSNVGSRVGSQVILWTTSDTEIRWGQPPSSTDTLAEATPAAKLQHLRTVSQTFAGQYPQWVDIRFDAIKYLKPSADAADGE
jgi:hypothetical protein